MKSHEREELWIDYVDGDLDLEMKRDLESLASHRREDREGITAYGRLRKALKLVGRQEIPKDEKYWRNLHARIMDGVQKKRIKPRYTLRIALGVAAVLVLILTASLAQKRLFHGGESGSGVAAVELALDPFLRVSSEDPSGITDDLLSHENLDDIVLEAAVRKMERLSDRDLEWALDGLKSL